VLLTAETGVAEVLVTAQDAWILTDEIEAQRHARTSQELRHKPLADAVARASFVCEATTGGFSVTVPPAIKTRCLRHLHHKRVMMPSELERYRRWGV